MDEDVKRNFKALVDRGNPVGEVTSVNSFLVEVRGLQPVNVHALVVFDDGSKGFVHHVLENRVLILHLGDHPMKQGALVVLQHNELLAKVGKDFIGRVISVTGDPLDGGGPIAAEDAWRVFNDAPPIYAREMLEQQLETGVNSIDTLFPLVRGQRMSLLGESKSGKSTLATQMVINQRDTDQVVVYVMIAKRRSDVDILLTRLRDNKALDKAIVIVSSIFESLVLSYLAPYVGCTMAEYFWQKEGIDTLIVYDDLTTHAQALREISLLSGTSPGRDSYPGNIFHAHSSLLERAGRLKANHHCLTSLPLVTADGGDITSFLPTNIMSITDGQWILDMKVFREGVRPALNTGLSVTRVGTRGYNDRQKDQNSALLKALAAYEQAQEFSHFGAELSDSARADIVRGTWLKEAFTQIPGETYSLNAQQLLMGVILETPTTQPLDIPAVKKKVIELAKNIKAEEDFNTVKAQLTQSLPLLAAPGAGPAQPASPDQPATTAQPSESSPQQEVHAS
ncbi:MAG TPA: sodium-transporting two-sector ATPase [Candidatus Saccharimonadales bacterium]|nr:sodium-transporting two-sector ATPase [Candidatus Saccharimonadales bacterium]